METTVKNKIGLTLAALLAIGDVVTPFTPPLAADEATNGPPFAVIVAGAVLGVITLVCAVHMWRTGNRISARLIAGTRILSALSAMPAFIVSGIPPIVVALVAAGVLLTVLSVVLVLSRPTGVTAES
ncbi:hypothetical protein ACFO1B_22880 [Dactylosporangium siamense]|uniref:Uncharacterized protein n=1 Tax=Dactylosporangium siamense TaxID=685454 RepID=A0A919PN59_9ACTN|nr:hypothetical protein [Dactylosporangium siamense]GIG47039.1 hypothetical protein Dsi01nite_050800 [Dactylosporangium siamense]